MKTKIMTAVVVLLASTAVPAFAQTRAVAASTSAGAAARYAVDKTPIDVMWADPKARELLLKELPDIQMYLDTIKDMTLVQVAPQSGGVIDDAKLKTIQAGLDAIK